MIKKSAYGQYLTEARVNSYSVNFLVDTGANIIALTYEDAINIGIDVRGLNFKVEVQTAAGMTKVAAVIIENISIEHIEYQNLYAVVFKQDELSVSLLGMNFLNKLSSFKFKDHNLIMKQ
jgi:aspartyl protease family protein